MAILIFRIGREKLVPAKAPTAEGSEEAGQPLLEGQPSKSEDEDGEEAGRIDHGKKYITTWSYEYYLTWWGSVRMVAYIWLALSICSVLFGKPTLPSTSRPKAYLQRCPDPAAIPAHAPRQNIWKNLNMAEAMSVRDWLSAPERGLNITPSDRAYDSDNIIHYVEAFKPNKAAALAYLANSSIGIDKYAHAIVNSGTNETIVDYLVGPLPISDKTTLRPLNEIYRDPIPLNARATFNWTVLGEYARSHIGPMDEILVDLFGGSILNGTVLPAGVAPMSYDGEWRRTWLQLRRTLPGSWIRPLDFFIYLDMTGTDPSLYRILRIVHDGKAYESIADVFAAWRRGEMKRTIDDQSNWASRAIQGKARDLDDRAGPRQVMFDGARHRVDRKQDWVSWMDWSFYFSFERDMGLHLWDINFGGERIIYELSPQEAMAQYSGSDPHQSATVWLDRAFGMGGNVREVIVGYDCPEHATLFDAMVHESGTSVRKRAICVFERDRGTPLSRHTGTSKDEMGAIKGYELVVRSISTVGNYDYLFDYVFQLDGTIEIRVSASGYLQGGLWDPSQDPYGHQLQMQSMGSLHDHVINFKVDFDVAGARNSMMAVTLDKEETPSKWDDDWGSTKVQQRINRKVIDRESLLEYPPKFVCPPLPSLAQAPPADRDFSMQGTYVVYNPSSRNAYNNPRGYSIHPGPTCHLTNLDAKRTEKNVNWAKHHLAVSRRKEEEPSSSSGWNINLPGAPPVNFYDFFDDESVEEEDLVVWLNLGTHHVPRAEDSPNTLTNLATSYVLLVPYNFHDHDPSIDSHNSVLLNKKHGRYEIHEAVKPKQCIPPYLGPLSYGGLEMWDEHGNIVDPDEGSYDTSSHGMRLWH